MQYTVVFTPEAQEQLAALYRYIAAAASPEIAQRYTFDVDAEIVPIIGVFYGGQDYETFLQPDLND